MCMLIMMLTTMISYDGDDDTDHDSNDEDENIQTTAILDYYKERHAS